MDRDCIKCLGQRNTGGSDIREAYPTALFEASFGSSFRRCFAGGEASTIAAPIVRLRPCLQLYCTDRPVGRAWLRDGMTEHPQRKTDRAMRSSMPLSPRPGRRKQCFNVFHSPLSFPSSVSSHCQPRRCHCRCRCRLVVVVEICCQG